MFCLTTTFPASRWGRLAWLRYWLVCQHKACAIAIMVAINIAVAHPALAADPPAPRDGVVVPDATDLLRGKPIRIGKPPEIFAPKFVTDDDKPPSAEPIRQTVVPGNPVRSSPRVLLPDAMQDNAPRGTDQITETALQSLSVDALGTIGEGESAFPRSFWFGLSRTRIAGLIEALPVSTDSPGTRSLLRRLLLSPLDMPEADQAGNGNLLTPRANEPGPPRFPRGKVSGAA